MQTKEFLNPKAAIAPAVAGGTVMLITNALINQFDLSGPKVALCLSFLIGALVFVTNAIPLWQRLIYYVLNSLIVFAMATGTASIGYKAEARAVGIPAIETTGITTMPPQFGTNVVSTGETNENVLFTNQSVAALQLTTTANAPGGFFKPW